MVSEAVKENSMGVGRRGRCPQSHRESLKKCQIPQRALFLWGPSLVQAAKKEVENTPPGREIEVFVKLVCFLRA